MISRSGRQCPQAPGHMLWIFIAFPSPHRPAYVPHTILPSRDTRARAGDGDVTTIVSLASRRGIINVHCHRLIEFGTDRICPRGSLKSVRTRAVS